MQFEQDMTVAEWIEMLKKFPADAKVHFSSNPCDEMIDEINYDSRDNQVWIGPR